VVSGVSLNGHRQAAVRDVMFMNFGRSRMAQMLEELVLPFSALCFCSSESGEKKKKEKKRKKQLSSEWARQQLLFCRVLRLPGL
jgi:hypothetical protein